MEGNAVVSSSAERIVIDDEVLSKQLQTLSSAEERLNDTATTSSNSLGEGSFGLLNSFLASSINAMASQTAEIVADATQLTKRIHEGLSAAKESFAQFEDDAALSFKDSGK